MKRYEIVYPIRHPERGIVREGTVELSERRGKVCVSNGSLRPAAGGQPKPGQSALWDAIAQLDPENPDHFTQGGKPECAELERLTGVSVSARERDAAWDTFQEQQSGE